MSIEVANESGVEVDEAELIDVAAFVIARMDVHPAAELSITLVDKDTMADLHVTWMNLPGPTDVMSFPMDELTPGTPEHPAPEGLLGDVVLCPSVAAKQTAESGHSAVEEMLLLTVHSILHLLGYDHMEEDERTVMFELQRKLLLTFLASRPSA